MILAERAARLEAEAKLAHAHAEAALITYYKLEIEKLRRQLYGIRSERKARLLEQMELALEEEATAMEDELAAEKAAAQTQTVTSFQRKRLPANRSQPICRASASSSRRRRGVHAVVRARLRSWASTSPRRSRSCPGDGR
jgi:hypothetical protein